MADQPMQTPNAGGSTGGNSTGSGLAPNIASLLCYVCTIITGIVFLVLEKDNKEVKFHAWQAIFLGGFYFVCWIAFLILSQIPYIGIISSILSIIVYIAVFVTWIVAMIKAYKGEHWLIPVIGPLAEQQANK